MPDNSYFSEANCVRVSNVRSEVIQALSSINIGTKLVCGGKLLKRRGSQHIKHRKLSFLKNSDIMMHETTWTGNPPGLSDEKIGFMTAAIVDSATSK